MINTIIFNLFYIFCLYSFYRYFNYFSSCFTGDYYCQEEQKEQYLQYYSLSVQHLYLYFLNLNNSKKNNIVPKTIIKEIRDVITNVDDTKKEKPKKLTKKELAQMIENVEREMREAAKNLDFERAMELRDILFEMKLGTNEKDL